MKCDFGLKSFKLRGEVLKLLAQCRVVGVSYRCRGEKRQNTGGGYKE
jgi:hypothetical protein